MLKNTAPVRMARPISFVTTVAKQGRSYLTIVIWLLYTAFRGRTAKLATTIALVALYLAGQAAAIFIIFTYARQMEKGGALSVPILGIEVANADDPIVLWAVVIFSTICFVASAGFMFLSRQLALRIIEDHLAKSMEQVALVSARLPDPRARLASQSLIENSSAVNSGCARGAIVAFIFTAAVSAAVGGVGAFFFLFYIDVGLTSLILLAVGLGSVQLYPLALRAVSMARFREQARVNFRQEVRSLQQAGSSSVRRLTTVNDLARGILGRRRISTEFTFAIEVGVTVILGLVIYYMASQALTGGADWAIFIAYIAALRLTLSACSRIIQAFASVSRYYPEIIRYYLFTKNVQKLDQRRLGKLKPGEAVVLGTLPNGDDVVVSAGERLAVVTTDPVESMRFALLDAKAAHSTRPLGTIYLNPATPSVGDAAIIIVDSDPLAEIGEEQRRTLDALLADKVTLINYWGGVKIGSFGETHLLIFAEGALRRFLPLGTSETDDVLEQFSRMAAMQRKKGVLDTSDEDEAEE